MVHPGGGSVVVVGGEAESCIASAIWKQRAMYASVQFTSLCSVPDVSPGDATAHMESVIFLC